MNAQISVIKTGKLFIGGAAPRSESGRTLSVQDRQGRVVARVAHASRKDVRDAVEAAAAGTKAWSSATAYLRGQVLYRWAEMLQGRAAELQDMLHRTSGSTAAAAKKETAASIDRLVSLAGWCDKLDQVLGCRNAVAGPYHNHTMPQARGVLGLFTPPQPGLLGLVSMVGAALVPGNAVVAVVPHEAAMPAVLLSEMLAVSDVPPGAVNVLTGKVDELLEPLGSHGGVHGILAAGLDRTARTTLRRAAASSVLRPVECLDFDIDVWYDDARACSPWFLERLVDHKTIWHPAAS